MPGPAERRHPGVRVRRSALAPADVARRDGIPVTSPARTLVDLAAVLGPRALRRAVGQAQALRLVSLAQLAAALERTGPRRGRGALRGILAAGPAPTRSELEDVVLALILRGGLARPEVNVPLILDGRRVIPDFRWPARRLVLEADGAAWHDHRVAREDDAERQALLERHGERVLRVTWEQAVASPDHTLARLRAAGAPEAPRGRPGRRRARRRIGRWLNPTAGTRPTPAVRAPIRPAGPIRRRGRPAPGGRA